ncbi:IPT/TIG domain-containing protein [Actinomadura kijaniata]|uniref:IPT/TIG domain-containing protein n=1 Tax=Actinomadura kijaniata TaxID=46161 RepID=UPI003F1C9952
MGVESPVGSGFARTRDIVVVAALLVLLAVGLIVVLVQMWPPPLPASAAAQPERVPAVRVDLFGWTARVSREASLFAVVLAAGAVGATVHAMRSLFWYVGNRSLRRSWLMMYLFLPFTGALLALVVYLVLRGGLTSPTGGSTDVNPYGMAAIAALVGLFSRETSEKLRAVFATLLAPAQAGRDQALPPQVHSVEPASGPVGTEVLVRGSGLRSATAVRFGGVDAPAAEVTDDSVRATVPAGATSGRLTVRTPAGSATSPADFTVE